MSGVTAGMAPRRGSTASDRHTEAMDDPTTPPIAVAPPPSAHVAMQPRRAPCRAVIHTDGTVTLYVGPEVIEVANANDLGKPALWRKHRALVPPVKYTRVEAPDTRTEVVTNLAKLDGGAR